MHILSCEKFIQKCIQKYTKYPDKFLKTKDSHMLSTILCLDNYARIYLSSNNLTLFNLLTIRSYAETIDDVIKTGIISQYNHRKILTDIHSEFTEKIEPKVIHSEFTEKIEPKVIHSEFTEKIESNVKHLTKLPDDHISRSDIDKWYITNNLRCNYCFELSCPFHHDYGSWEMIQIPDTNTFKKDYCCGWCIDIITTIDRSSVYSSAMSITGGENVSLIHNPLSELKYNEP
jgi:hypothetical protein